MPTIRSTHICTLCRRSFTGSGSLCPRCKPKDDRPSPTRRGYGYAWQKIRAQVLKDAGIPQDQWPLYDVDHNPVYNPAIESDHTKYTLIPRLHADHSRKTAECDRNGSFRGRKW